MARAWNKIVFAFLLSLLPSFGAGAAERDVQAEKEARKAIGAYFEAWNTADNAALRENLVFPHVSLFAGSELILAEKPEEFRVDFEAMRKREQWKKSTVENVEVTRSSKAKVHCIVTYARHNTDGKQYRTGKVFFIMVKKDGHWGMQLRAASGPSPSKNAANEKGGRKAIDAFFVAWNNADNPGIHESITFPHFFMVGEGRVRLAKDGDQLITNFDRMREQSGWHDSTLDSISIVHRAANLLACEIVFSRRHEDGTTYLTVPALWFLTQKDGEWGIQGRSIMPPTFSAD